MNTYLNNLLCLITGEIAMDISYENSRTRNIWEHNYLQRFSIFKAFNFVYSI